MSMRVPVKDRWQLRPLDLPTEEDVRECPALQGAEDNPWLRLFVAREGRPAHPVLLLMLILAGGQMATLVLSWLFFNYLESPEQGTIAQAQMELAVIVAGCQMCLLGLSALPGFLHSAGTQHLYWMGTDSFNDPARELSWAANDPPMLAQAMLARRCAIVPSVQSIHGTLGFMALHVLLLVLGWFHAPLAIWGMLAFIPSAMLVGANFFHRGGHPQLVLWSITRSMDIKSSPVKGRKIFMRVTRTFKEARKTVHLVLLLGVLAYDLYMFHKLRGLFFGSRAVEQFMVDFQLPVFSRALIFLVAAVMGLVAWVMKRRAVALARSQEAENFSRLGEAGRRVVDSIFGDVEPEPCAPSEAPVIPAARVTGPRPAVLTVLILLLFRASMFSLLLGFAAFSLWLTKSGSKEADAVADAMYAQTQGDCTWVNVWDAWQIARHDDRIFYDSRLESEKWVRLWVRSGSTDSLDRLRDLPELEFELAVTLELAGISDSQLEKFLAHPVARRSVDFLRLEGIPRAARILPADFGSHHFKGLELLDCVFSQPIVLPAECTVINSSGSTFELEPPLALSSHRLSHFYMSGNVTSEISAMLQDARIESKTLQIVNCSDAVDLGFLSVQTGIERLILRDLTALASLNGLESLAHLRLIYIADCPLLTDIGALVKMSGLREIELSGLPLVPPDSLQSLEALNELELLKYNHMTVHQISNVPSPKSETNSRPTWAVNKAVGFEAERIEKLVRLPETLKIMIESAKKDRGEFGF